MDKDLKKIALDIYTDKIFCSRQLRNPEKELSMVFIPLIFMDEEQRKKLEDYKPALMYEYYDKALPRVINGYPMFMSMHTLNEEESDKMWEYYEKIKTSVDVIVEKE